jgi:hypothetical protein
MRPVGLGFQGACAGFYIVGPAGLGGLLGRMPTHGRVGLRAFVPWLGQHTRLKSLPRTCPTSCSGRPRPDTILLGSCFGLIHGPRAI